MIRVSGCGVVLKFKLASKKSSDRKQKSEKCGLGVSPSCRFFIRGEPPNKNAASGAPFQERTIA